ncbi:aminoacyl-tRNA hydrolase [Dictyobacter arantiisoli]|uniref:Peptidyl-tRNA hydrolase n=1 Tax=Dictyobacter arantiisoli TaxID=2014874 RepID=A0A5A5T8S1_9CHLR|nr:aminoacyl-tRNA hydrolase [Dictyobacter arantiisoli]GCF07871.1 peptidyl-tRNA hydrolase [Dictyobacter arantiisoli]
MKLVIGLGNPGTQYEKTRHNVGFHVVDALASSHGLRWERRGRAMIANGTLANEKVVLVKPTTFMNNSGEAVVELLRWFKIEPEDLIVIYDDLDLPIGQIRLRAQGSSGGHNGINSMISHLHTNQFPRLRVGIGRPANQRMDTVKYVLGVPTGDESIQQEIGEQRAAEAIPLYLEKGLETTMNLINVDPEAKKKAEEKRRLQQERREQEKRRKAEQAAQLQEVAATLEQPSTQEKQHASD